MLVIRRVIHRASQSRHTRMASSIVFVTGNSGKLAEVASLMSTKGASIPLSNKNLDLPELQGTAEEISIAKCKTAAAIVAGPVFVEDTSLNFNALGGMPGPFVKWFLESIGHQGLYKMIDSFEDKTGWAQTTFSFCGGPDKPVHTFVGKTQGTIVSPRGDPTFAALTWDPIFEPLRSDGGDGRTYAEMTKDEKNKISHRMKALFLLIDFLRENPNEWQGPHPN